jgi:hypothetical protein
VQYFWEWALKPLLRFNGASRILEIGASFGGNTEKLLKDLPQARIAIIDPCFDDDLVARYSDESRVVVHKGRSLEVLPDLSGEYDAILMDGDHNYYTVYNELNLIAKRTLLAENGFILLHDMGPPYGRKDMFYDRDAVPPEAKASGRPEGVRTAVEAFMSGAPEPYRLLVWRAQHGLGCLVRERDYKPSLKFAALLWHGIRWKNWLLRRLGLLPYVSRRPVSR